MKLESSKIDLPLFLTVKFLQLEFLESSREKDKNCQALIKVPKLRWYLMHSFLLR